MAFALLHQDDFNRSDRTLSGDTMSDGLGAWTERPAGSSWSIVSNQADCAAGGGVILYDSAMSAVDVQKAEATYYGSVGGPAVRCSAGTGGHGNAYAAHCNPTIYVFRFTNGIGTIIGFSTGAGTAAGEVVSISAEGSTIRSYDDGVLVHDLTDSTHATGVCGLYGSGGTTPTYDDFADYIEAAAGHPATRRLGLIAGMRPLEIGREGARII